jgi:pimeloyl-ACP methyl ester carboxylesterase
MTGLTPHDLADDVAKCVRALGPGPVVMLGHAFGNFLARVATGDHPHLVTAVLLAAAEASKVPKDVSKTPFVVGDPSVLKAERLSALQRPSSRPTTTRASG